MSAPSLRSGVTQALAVLEEVARSGPTLSANGIARALSLPRTSAYRLVNSLVSEEYLVRHPTLDGFLLGVRVVELAHLVAPSPPPAADIVANLRAETGQAVHFVRYQRGRVVIVDEDPTHPLRSAERTRRQLAATAIGRLLLSAFAPPLSAHADQGAVMEVVSTARASGITGAEHRAIAAEVAALGYAACADADDRACIAVPVHSDDGRLVAGLALSSPAGFGPGPEQHLDRLRADAALVARSLGSPADAAGAAQSV
ncbi:helix-turn-helix domain-containing protein [Microbacterium sp. LMI12-1-1.1]|uniref:IclR family transcriptional regulator n=1 Tax=Microbacterium sp. LMI12-1-1.1 TaxID=3135225 RepID=UPI003436B297